jgi:eukaryotic-like serine/threonine-protein kinase
VRKLANVFMFDVHGAIQDLPGSTPARQMLVENSLKYLAVLSAESAGESSLQRELASAYEKVADVQGGYRIANLGDTTGAISSYRKALALREQLAAADPQDREVRRDLLRNHGKLSELLSGEGDMTAAIESSRRATKLAQQLAALPGATAEDRRNVATALLSLGWQLARADQLGDGVLFIRQSIAVFETLRKETPADGVIQRNLSLAYGRLGETLLNNTQLYQEALEAHRRSYEIVSEMLAQDPHNTRLGKIVAYAELGMASALTQLKQPRAALVEQSKAVDVFREMLKADSKNEVARYDAAFALSEAGATLITLGDLGEAENRLTEALGVLSHSPGVTATSLNDSKVLLGIDYYRLGLIHAARAAPLAPAEQRKGCEEARKWFALGEPIVSLANTAEDVEWRTPAKDVTDRRDRETGPCVRT